jgi:hypothetical protein
VDVSKKNFSSLYFFLELSIFPKKERKMREKTKLEKKWVVMMLPLIFLLMVSASYAFTTITTTISNVQAHVTVIPSVTGICFPQTFVVKEAFGNVNCFIEVAGIDASQLNTSSITLGISENSTPGIHIILGSVTYVNDFNNNGIHDLFIQFDFSKLKNYFAGLSLPGNFHYQLSGSEPVFPFSFTQTSPVFAKSNVQAAQYTSLIDYTTAFEGKGGSIVMANNFPISKYISTNNQFSGYFVQRVNYPNENVQSWGNPIFSSQGSITIDFIVFKWVLAQSLTVVPDGLVSCSSTTNSTVICQGSGRMIMQGDWMFGSNSNIPVKTIVWIISPTATKIFGFDSSNNKILEIENITLKTLSLTKNIS